MRARYLEIVERRPEVLGPARRASTLLHEKIAVDFIGSKDCLERVSDCSASIIVCDDARVHDETILIAKG
jgi:hypothetical protein